MKKWKILFKCVVFLAVFMLLGTGLSKLLIPKWVEWSQMATFYGLEQDSLDVIFVGSSSFYVGFAPAVVWSETGINSYVLGSSVQAPEVTYLRVEEALRNQNPKVMVLGTLFLFEEYNPDTYETYVRVGIDPIKMSAEKAGVAWELVHKSENQTLESYLFPLLRYHDRWKELGQADFEEISHDNQHGRSTAKQSHIEKIGDLNGRMEPNAAPAQYNENSLYYYEKAIQLCKNAGIEVLLATAPRADWDASRAAATRQLAERYGLKYIDYNDDALLETLEINFDTDFYDGGHLNIQGATKLSCHMSYYLQKTYSLEDRRSEKELTASWEEDVQIFYNDLDDFQKNILPEKE